MSSLHDGGSPVSPQEPLLSTVDLEQWTNRATKLVPAFAITSYVVGYMVWAAYAARSGLGVPPTLNAQYWLVGVAPTVLSVFVAIAIALVWRAVGPRMRRFHVGAYRWKRVILAAVAGTALGMTIITVPGVTLWLLVDPDSWLPLLLVLPLAAACLIWATEPVMVAFFLFMIGANIVITLGAAYVMHALPLIAQEWGGAHPKCVVLDISSSAFSPDTLALLLPDGSSSAAAVSDEPSVLQSRPLWLASTMHEMALIVTDNKTYWLTKEGIRAIRPGVCVSESR